MEKDFNIAKQCVRVSVEEMDGVFPEFSCGNVDLDDFFHNDALPYCEQLLGKTYVMVLADNPGKVVCAFTLSNDSVKMALVPSNKIKNRLQRPIPNQKRMRSYPAVLIGRLGVAKEFQGLNIGGQLLLYIMMWFLNRDNKTGCRFLVVDAYNTPAVLKFYERNGFRYFYDTEEQERKAFHIPQDETLHQRLMIFDLITLAKKLREKSFA